MQVLALYTLNQSLFAFFCFSSCFLKTTCAINDKEDNPRTLNGGLVGGVDINDVYNDDRTDSKHNGVAVDQNAGFQGALAGMYDQ